MGPLVKIRGEWAIEVEQHPQGMKGEMSVSNGQWTVTPKWEMKERMKWRGSCREKMVACQRECSSLKFLW